MGIEKSPGTTPTERLLADLCDQTFLRLWSYPNPYRDDGDELCDLLVVFGEHVFIFFDREGRHFSKTHRDPEHNWERWKREVIERQVRSTRGAERYLKTGRAVFLDSKRTTAFPIKIPSDRMIIHKIVVAHGAKEACEEFSDQNIYGSLGISYSSRADGPQMPFMIHLDKEDPVHVLDSHTLPIILGELDTIADLTWYLDAKLEAIRRFDFLLYCGEEDLLAHYFLNFDEAQNRHFIGPKDHDVNGVALAEGEWKGLIDRPEYKRKKQADQASYLWDNIIQITCQNALDGTLSGNSNLLEGRSAIHEMAREPRFSRRALAEEMLSAIERFPDLPGAITRHVNLMPSYYEGKGYVFLQLRVRGLANFEGEDRARRQALLEIACGAAKNKIPNLNTIVGIAIGAPKFYKQNAEDFILMDCREWPEERRVDYEEANRELKFFQTDALNMRFKKVQNFPDAEKNGPA